MLTVHVLAKPLAMTAVSAVIAEDAQINPGLRTNNAREALGYGYFSPRDVLLIDDGVLRENPGLIQSFARLTGRKIVLAPVRDADAARRALALAAVNMVDAGQIAEELRPLLRSLDDQPDAPLETVVISVYSAKGGVGKSTLALNLAWALARQSDYRVALIDWDPLGDIGAMIQEKPGVSVVDVTRGLSGGLAPEKALQSLFTIRGIGLTIVPAPLGLHDGNDIGAEDVHALVEAVRGEYAYVVLDLATGLSDINLAALDVSDHVLVLAAPERVTLATVARALAVLRGFYEDKLSLVLNRGDTDTGLERPEVEGILHQEIRYVLSSGGSGPVRASNKGRALVVIEPKNALARSITAIAQELVSAREGSRRRSRRWFAEKL